MYQCVYLHKTGHHSASALPRLVVDVGSQLNDLARCVTLHVALCP